MFVANRSKEEIEAFEKCLKLAASIKNTLDAFKKVIKNRKILDVFVLGLRSYSGNFNNIISFYRNFGYNVTLSDLQKELEGCQDRIFKTDSDRNQKEWGYILFLVMNELIDKLDETLILSKYATILKTVKQSGEAFNKFMQSELTPKHLERANEAAKIILKAVISEE